MHLAERGRLHHLPILPQTGFSKAYLFRFFHHHLFLLLLSICNQKATLTVSHSASIDHINITNRDTPSINPKPALTLQHPHSNRLHRPKNTLCLPLSPPPPLLLPCPYNNGNKPPTPSPNIQLVDTTLPHLTSPKLAS